jgi:hypothetical protein
MAGFFSFQPSSENGWSVIVLQIERDQVASVMLMTLKGNFFDVPIHLEASQVEEKEGSNKKVARAAGWLCIWVSQDAAKK